jgi:hypothetical protein
MCPIAKAGAAALFAFSLLSAAEQPQGNPGRVYFQRLSNPPLDRYLNPDRKQWFRTHYFRMGVFSPFFDPKTSWYQNAVVYMNLYGVDPGTPILREHPEWILHDSGGHFLFIPFDCKNGTCARYAGDVASPGFRNWWIGEMKKVLSRGHYAGLWIDDVNMEFRVGDGYGKQSAPLDSTTGRPMTWNAWRDHVASFTEEIRRAFPKLEIIENPIWFAGPQPTRDKDPAIQRQLRTADSINIERGSASDQGLTGGTGQWSIHALLDYIDRVHAAGPGVTMEEYDLDSRNREYALAGYFLISSGKDRFGDGNSNPENWWRGYDVDLGAPLGPRVYRDGVYSRAFSRGMVLLGEPGLASQTVQLPSAFITLEGTTPVRSIHLSARQGVILLKADDSLSSANK